MEFKIILKKLNGTITEKEKDVFNEWYNQSVEHRSYFNNVSKNYSEELNDIDIEKAWERLNKKLKRKPTNKNTWKYAVAAAVVVFLVSVPLLINNQSQSTIKPIITNNNIVGGSNKATLTLEDGSLVVLQKGELLIRNYIESNGERLKYSTSKTQRKEDSYNYLTTPTGGQYHIELADGTKVWLNSESQLKYPVSFTSGEIRQVELLYGEAYFDVSHSSNHNGSRFRVLTKGQEIEVLGTEFNIKAYANENYVCSTIVEGTVLMKTLNFKNTLSPNQQTILNLNTNKVELLSVNDMYSITSWKKGVFSFNNMPLHEIMKVLSRWYDAEVLFVNKEIKDIRFTGVLGKNQTIEEILFTIYNTNNIQYEINNKSIIFK